MEKYPIPRIQDDLYLAINGQWQHDAKIAPDLNSAGITTDLNLKVEKQLIEELEATPRPFKIEPQDHFAKAALLFAKAQDFKQRDAQGIDPLKKRLARVLALKSWEDFGQELPNLILDNFTLPFEISVLTNLHDAQSYQLMLMSPDIILPDVTSYQDPEQGPVLLAIYEKMIGQLLAFTPLSNDQQAQFVKDTLQFDRLIVPYHISNEAMADFKNLDHPVSSKELAKQLKSVPIKLVLQKILPEVPDQINLLDQNYFANFAQVFNPQTFTMWQHWAYVNELTSHSSYLSQKIREVGAQYSMAITGQQKLATPKRHAYNITNDLLAEPLGIYYGKKYFGPEAKAAVTKMVKALIKVYEQQIRDNSWLSESTKAQAIKKLETMVIKMGYPEKALPLYDQLQISPDQPLVAIVDEFNKVATKFSLNRLNQPVDRNEWGMAAHEVNAQYNDSLNDITFPAAILQPPFFDLKASASANLGGAGATIGHEISHAFDNNGALFDEYGNKYNWWQPADYQNFEKYTQAMIKQFDGIRYAGSKINGKLVVSENIADNAGINAALQVLHQVPDPDFQEFFTTYALTWRTKIRPELAKTLLKVDVHAPASLRTNIPVRNFPEWYQAFKVKATDQMYLPIAQRLVIW